MIMIMIIHLFFIGIIYRILDLYKETSI